MSNDERVVVVRIQKNELLQMGMMIDIKQAVGRLMVDNIKLIMVFLLGAILASYFTYAIRFNLYKSFDLADGSLSLMSIFAVGVLAFSLLKSR